MTISPRIRVGVVAWGACALSVALSATFGAGAAGASVMQGQVLSGKGPLRSSPVSLYGVRPGKSKRPERLAHTRSRGDGTFRIRYDGRRRKTILYLLVGKRDSVQLASVLGKSPGPSQVVVNERTTVASGFALAQFIKGGAVGGPSPGLQNAAGMVRNLVNVRTGEISGVLAEHPNGSSTTTRLVFNSLANMLPRCARNPRKCKGLFRLAKPPGGRVPRGALEAVANIARNPWKNVGRLFKLAVSGPAPFRPALAPTDRPDAWTLALRFNGNGTTLNGPGNLAIDARGNVWVNSNYIFAADPLQPVCAGNLVFKFNPRGRYVKGSPYTGGGLSGAGYGITLDPRGRVWVGNFGFAGHGCSELPPRNSVSLFSPSGKAVSPSTGFTQGGVSFPQATVSDRKGNIWIANCDDGSVTRYPGGNPAAAQYSGGIGISKPFSIAFNRKGQAFVTGVGSDSVAMLNKDGSPAPGSPITGGGIKRPLGIASDSRGNVWVSNSGVINLPCPDPNAFPLDGIGGSVTLIDSGGTPQGAFTGAGMTIPWGIAVDGNDNVWVANFNGQRLSAICGLRRKGCRPGGTPGSAISPPSGYGTDALLRNTGVQVDPSGNLWLANNWRTIPIQANPGGREVVVVVGLAGPLKTPLLGTPTSP